MQSVPITTKFVSSSPTMKHFENDFSIILLHSNFQFYSRGTIWLQLDLHILMKYVCLNTINVNISIPTHCEVYSIQPFVTKCVIILLLCPPFIKLKYLSRFTLYTNPRNLDAKLKQKRNNMKGPPYERVSQFINLIANITMQMMPNRQHRLVNQNVALIHTIISNKNKKTSKFQYLFSVELKIYYKQNSAKTKVNIYQLTIYQSSRDLTESVLSDDVMHVWNIKSFVFCCCFIKKNKIQSREKMYDSGKKTS